MTQLHPVFFTCQHLTASKLEFILPTAFVISFSRSESSLTTPRTIISKQSAYSGSNVRSAVRTAPRHSMPNFMDLAREIRDMIYAEALYTDHILVAKPEDADKLIFLPEEPQISLALLRVSQQLNQEAARVFFAVNTFHLRPVNLVGIHGDPTQHRFPLFELHATLFQSIVLKLRWHDSTGYYDQVTDLNVEAWHKKLQLLTPMVNLKCLYLEVDGLLLATRRNGSLYSRKKESEAWTFVQKLFNNLPVSVRRREGNKHRGIWIIGDFQARKPRHRSRPNNASSIVALLERPGRIPDGIKLLGENGRECGLNFMMKGGHAVYPMTENGYYRPRIDVFRPRGCSKFYYG